MSGAGVDTAPGTARLGATPRPGGGCAFRVWAPRCERLVLRLLDPERLVTMTPAPRGYHEAVVDGAGPGDRYLYMAGDGGGLPDPASRAQPEGVHGPSMVVDPEFEWDEGGWRNPPMAQHVFYELHVGTFTPEGTFDAAIGRLDDLADLGVTGLQLMPVARFPGRRNWGYDGVDLFAAQDTYGGVAGLKRLVNASHRRGLAVLLDVVYNHLGPEGNYLAAFGPYFTDRYRTPWGPALNFDGPGADEVRAFFIDNALYWTGECRIDGLRLDAVHAIVDGSARPFVEELTERVHAEAAAAGRRVHVIAESATNDARLVRPREAGGIGLDGQWNDDYHHALHALITPERDGYYVSYGTLGHLARALERAYVYTGEYSPFHGRRHGRPTDGVAGDRFVVFGQNHDQIGNRRDGERLTALVSFEARKLAAAMTVLSPFVPLLFMGEEYDEPAPFLYFVSHGDEDLVEAVRRGRREEFSSFRWSGPPPDPQADSTFARSRLDWDLRARGRHARMLAWYRRLIRLRRETPGLGPRPHDEPILVEVAAEAGSDTTGTVAVVRGRPGRRLLLCANFAGGPATVAVPALTAGAGAWTRLLDSADPAFGGTGAGAAPRLEPAAGPAASVALGPWGVTLYREHDA